MSRVSQWVKVALFILGSSQVVGGEQGTRDNGTPMHKVQMTQRGYIQVNSSSFIIVPPILGRVPTPSQARSFFIQTNRFSFRISTPNPLSKHPRVNPLQIQTLAAEHTTIGISSHASMHTAEINCFPYSRRHQLLLLIYSAKSPINFSNLFSFIYFENKLNVPKRVIYVLSISFIKWNFINFLILIY
jgi:hypothetical protein